MKVRQSWEMKVHGYEENYVKACVSGMNIPCLPRVDTSRRNQADRALDAKWELSILPLLKYTCGEQ